VSHVSDLRSVLDFRVTSHIFSELNLFHRWLACVFARVVHSTDEDSSKALIVRALDYLRSNPVIDKGLFYFSSISDGNQTSSWSTMPSSTSTAFHHRSSPQVAKNMAKIPPLSLEEEDDEKDSKVQRIEEKRLMKVFTFLGILSIIFLVAITRVRHNRYEFPARMRNSRHLKHIENNQKGVALPSDSIYLLSVADSNGVDTRLSIYAGMVSLVVNVASK
jgi:hypothetical protein